MGLKHPLGPLKDKQAGLGQPRNLCEDRHEDSRSRKARQAGCGRAGGEREGEQVKGQGAGQWCAASRAAAVGASGLIPATITPPPQHPSAAALRKLQVH